MYLNLNPILEEELTSLKKLHWELGKAAEIVSEKGSPFRSVYFVLLPWEATSWHFSGPCWLMRSCRVLCTRPDVLFGNRCLWLQLRILVVDFSPQAPAGGGSPWDSSCTPPSPPFFPKEGKLIWSVNLGQRPGSIWSSAFLFLSLFSKIDCIKL